MRHYVLHDSEEWKLERWGGGIAYALTSKDLGRTLHVQGDGADEFERDLGVKEEYLSGDDLCDALWDSQGGEFTAT